MSRLLIAAIAVIAGGLPGCRADTGPDDYESQEALRLDAAPPPSTPASRRAPPGARHLLRGPADGWW
ncbi:MAG: hypothetical protein R3F60_19015 [bacterium]